MTEVATAGGERMPLVRFALSMLLLALGLILTALPAYAASRGLVVELKASEKAGAPTADRVQLYGSSHALVIGIDRYTGGWPRLRKAVADAHAVAARLKAHGFEVTLRENLDADQLQKTLKQFFARKGRDPDARLFLWYAGHGHTVDGEGYLVPADAPRANDPTFLVSALPLRDFGSLVRLARSKHVLSVFDACFAGTVFEARGTAPTAAITLKTTKPVRQFITSGDAGQQVRDDGSFREYFLRALRGDEKADFNDDGYVTGEELGLFLAQRMEALTQASQTPKAGKLHDVRFNQGDFVFALRKPTVTAPKVGGGFSLKDLEKKGQQERVHQAWTVKLNEMKAAFGQVTAFEKGDNTGSLKAEAWDRFASAFSQDNPFSQDDDRMRRHAQARARHWRSVAVVVPPKPAKPKLVQEIVGVFPNRGAVFRDLRADGSECPECPEMVIIPPGTFTMGSPESETTREGVPEKYAKRERPQHRVTIPRAFALGRYEVTKAQFATFVRDSGHDAGGGCYFWNGSKWEQQSSKSWRDPGFQQTDRDPVTCVSWDDAKAYVGWLGKKTGKDYRLPSEGEWEYAARARTATARYWGDGRGEACANANVNDRTSKSVNGFKWASFDCDDGYAGTAPVGSFRANAFGLHDMLGNLWEWGQDCWNESYSGAPTDGSAWTSGDCSRRVLRGGSWFDFPWIVRSAIRFRDRTTDRVDSFGFRISRTHP